MEKIEFVLPGDIEKRSFEIIGEELKERGITLPAEEEPVTKRVIHTSADFEYAQTMCYSKNAVQVARELLKRGASIVTDTNMAKAGINKTALSKLGGEVYCFMADEDVAREAKELFLESDVPYIINRGRKGGSNIAAAICNALLYGIERPV